MGGQAARLRQLRQIRDQSIGQIHRGGRDAARRQAELHPGRGVIEALLELQDCKASIGRLAARGGERKSRAGIAQCAGDGCSKSPARAPLRHGSAVPRGTCPNICTVTVRGPRVVSPPDQCDSMGIG